MQPFYDLNRLICRCLEVLNIFIALPFGTFIYLVSVDYLTRTIPSLSDSTTVYDSEITINVVSIILALIAVLYVNGGIAQALDKRRFLEHISQSVEDLDHAQHTKDTDNVTIIDGDKASATKTKPHVAVKNKTAKASPKKGSGSKAKVKSK